MLINPSSRRLRRIRQRIGTLERQIKSECKKLDISFKLTKHTIVQVKIASLIAILILSMGCYILRVSGPDSSKPHEPFNTDKFEDYKPWWATNSIDKQEIK